MIISKVFGSGDAKGRCNGGSAFTILALNPLRPSLFYAFISPLQNLAPPAALGCSETLSPTGPLEMAAACCCEPDRQPFLPPSPAVPRS